MEIWWLQQLQHVGFHFNVSTKGHYISARRSQDGLKTARLGALVDGWFVILS